MSDGPSTMSLLRELDEATPWELSGDMLAVNDKEDGEDEGDAGVAVLRPEEPGGGLATGEEVEDMLSCAGDMAKNGDVEDILIVVNMTNDDQVCFTTIERNDLVLGCLETAKLNWYNTQLTLQGMKEGEDYDELD